MFGGTVNGLKDPNIKKIGPSNEVWILELYAKNQYSWSKLNVRGTEPPPRTNHIAVCVKKPDAADSTAVVFIFGGMASTKMDDGYYLEPNPTEIKFTKIQWESEQEGTEPQVPPPRANHGACVVDNYKVYVFGGNGGKGYENIVFRDLWMFNHMKNSWTNINYLASKFNFLIS